MLCRTRNTVAVDTLARLSQNQCHFLRERAVDIDPGTILRLDETIVKSGGESVEPPLSRVSPAASQLSQSYAAFIRGQSCFPGNLHIPNQEPCGRGFRRLRHVILSASARLASHLLFKAALRGKHARFCESPASARNQSSLGSRSVSCRTPWRWRVKIPWKADGRRARWR